MAGEAVAVLALPDNQYRVAFGAVAQVVAIEVVAIEAEYEHPFCAMIWRDNLFATQFHPEKSQAAGLRLLENFGRLARLRNH